MATKYLGRTFGIKDVSTCKLTYQKLGISIMFDIMENLIIELSETSLILVPYLSTSCFPFDQQDNTSTVL